MISRRRIMGVRLGSVFLLVMLILITVAILYPMLGMISLSLKTNAELATDNSLIPANPSFDNYLRMWRIAPFPTFFRNSALLSFGTILVTGVVASAAGYSLARFRFRGRDGVQLVIYFLQVMPGVIAIVPMYLLARATGLYNKLPGLLIVYIGITVPFATLMVRGFFMQIPIDMEEAAMVDGASRWQSFWHVALPLVRPGLLSMAIFVFIATWEEFILAMTLTNHPSVRTVPIGLTYFFEQYKTDYVGLMAASVVSSLPALIVFGIIGQRFVRGISAGGVKG